LLLRTQFLHMKEPSKHLEICAAFWQITPAEVPVDGHKSSCCVMSHLSHMERQEAGTMVSSSTGTQAASCPAQILSAGICRRWVQAPAGCHSLRSSVSSRGLRDHSKRQATPIHPCSDTGHYRTCEHRDTMVTS
ncbi:hypothetical protein H1C71_001358, partial [Ictidomys tridecemlineatus]